MNIHLSLLDFILAIGSSFLASLAFLYFILRIYIPRISISQHIIIRPDFENPQETVYLFKILNISWFSAYEVNIELTKLIKIPNSDNQMDVRITVLALKKNHLAHIPKHISSKRIKKTHFAPHAILFRTSEDLEGILNDDSRSVELQVSLRHGLTGLSRVYKREFARPGAICKGKEFKFGNDLGVE